MTNKQADTLLKKVRKKRDLQTTNVRYDIIIIILTTRGKKARVLRIVLAAERAAESLSSSQRNLEM